MTTTHITYHKRPITDKEYQEVLRGFDELTLSHHNPIQSAYRITYTAESDQRMIGCISGLAYHKDHVFNPYFHLTDLFLKPPYRNQGIGTKLLRLLEQECIKYSIKHIWT